MTFLLNLWCDHCERYEWHVSLGNNLYRCLGCMVEGNDKYICIACSRRVIAGSSS